MIFVSSPMAVFIKGFGGETRRGMGMSFRLTPSPIHFVYRGLEKSPVLRVIFLPRRVHSLFILSSVFDLNFYSTGAPEAPTFAADIAFILDSSSAVTPFQYTRAQRFVRILSEYLNISPGKSRGSLITVGDSPIVNFNFDGYNTHAEFRTLVTDASYLGGSSSITGALRTAATMFTGARRSYPWLVILVTPWRPRDIRDTRALEAAASPLLKRGIWLYVLSVSENPYVGWLRPVVVEPRDAFSVVSYRDLPANIGSLAGYITADNCKYTQ